MKPAIKSVLFKTSAKTDVGISGGVVSIAGLQPVSFKNITGVSQTKYRAEVAQVNTITTSGITPAASTFYGIVVYDPNRTSNGQTELAQSRTYGYTTPATLTAIGADAAAQRQYINEQIVAAVNNATNLCHATATNSTGASITITDNGGYYPNHSQSMTNVLGPNTVLTITNSGGTGFPQGIVAVTTPAVLSQGVGAKLLGDVPVLDKMFGNLISGSIAAPLTISGDGATSGQQYDSFTITSLLITETPTITGHYTYRDQEQYVYVDNGAGSSTSNLSGYWDFTRKMHQVATTLYKNDPSSVIEFFSGTVVFQDPLGLAPTGTANTLGWQMTPNTALYRVNIGTQTIVAPVLGANGLILDQDDTATEGSHTCASFRDFSNQEFIVGKDECSVVARVLATDWTDGQILVGLRKKATYTADYNDYTDLAAIGGGAADGDSVYTFGILNNAATVATDSAINFTDSAYAELLIKVAIDGKVEAYVNGTKCNIYSAGTTQMQFDSGDALIPFYQYVNIGGGDPVMAINEFAAVAANWIN